MRRAWVWAALVLALGLLAGLAWRGNLDVRKAPPPPEGGTARTAEAETRASAPGIPIDVAATGASRPTSTASPAPDIASPADTAVAGSAGARGLPEATTLTVRVRGPDGVPVPGVTAVAIDMGRWKEGVAVDGSEWVTAQADADGLARLALPGWAVGTLVNVQAGAPGLIGATEVRLGSHPAVVELVLAPWDGPALPEAERDEACATCVLTLTSGGEPLRNAEVELQQGPAGDGGAVAMAVGIRRRTDDEGRLRFERLDAGRWHLTLDVLGVGTRMLTVDLVAGQTLEKSLDFPRRSALEGTVFAPPGRLAEVKVRAQGFTGLATAAIEPTSDAAGRYRISGLAPGHYRLHAALSGFADAWAPLDLGTVAGPGPDLRVGVGATVRGRLLHRDGAPWAGALLVLAFPDGYDSIAAVQTDAAGRFQIAGVGAGTYVLAPTDGGRPDIREGFPTVVRDADLDLGDLGSVGPDRTGRIELQFRAPPDCDPTGAQVFAEDDTGREAFGWVDAAGHAVLEGLAAGRHRIWVRAGDSGAAVVVVASGGRSVVADVTLGPGATVEGVVTIPAERLAAGPMRVSVSPFPDEFGRWPRFGHRDAPVGADGRYRIGGLLPGRHQVRLDGATDAIEVALAAGQSARLDFPVAGWVAGLEVGVTGLPQGTRLSSVLARWPAVGAEPPGWVNVQVQGDVAALRWLRPGTVALDIGATRDGMRWRFTRDAQAAPGGGKVILAWAGMAGSGAVAGRTAPPVGASGARAWAVGPACRASTDVGADGVFRIEALPAGTYRVLAAAPSAGLPATGGLEIHVADQAIDVGAIPVLGRDR